MPAERAGSGAEAAALASELSGLREVGVEYVFLRLADCSLARRRRRQHQVTADEQEEAVEPETEDEDGDLDNDDDDDDDGDGDADNEHEVDEDEEQAPSTVEESLSWRLSRIKETCGTVAPALLCTAVQLARAHSQQQGCAMPEESAPIKFRVTAKRGGKGHDFSSDEVKREAALGLIGSQAVRAAHLEPALRAYEVSIRAQVHRKSFVLGYPLQEAPFHAHQGRRFGAASDGSTNVAPPTSGSSTVAAVAADNAAPQRHRAEIKVKSSADVDLSEWLPCKLAELGAAETFPRDARDLITPLHEMPYEEQVARKQREMTQVLKRMARKVRQAWQQDSARQLRNQRQASGAMALAPEPSSDPNEIICEAKEAPVGRCTLPAWLEPRDGELFVAMQPLRHCGAGHDATWRCGYRNKLELAVGVTSEGAVTVGVQQQHHGRDRSRKPGRGRGREQYTPTPVIPLSDDTSSICLRPSSVTEEMLRVGKAFTTFMRESCGVCRNSGLPLSENAQPDSQLDSRSDQLQDEAAEIMLPIFEARSGGHRVGAEGRGFWRGLVLRCSNQRQQRPPPQGTDVGTDGATTVTGAAVDNSRRPQMMVIVRVNARHLIEGSGSGAATTTADLVEIWRAERQRLAECLSRTGLVTSTFVQYDGLDSLVPRPSIFNSLLPDDSSIERISGDASGDTLEETLSGE